MSSFASSLIFVVGAQRSGTSWVQRLLASHPAVAGGQESHLFSSYLAPMRRRWEEEQTYRLEGGRTIGLACWMTEEELDEEMRGFARRTLERALTLKPTATRILEKTPDHGLHLPLIHRLFPEATVLHVQRDGRDVTASLLAAHQSEWGRGWTPSNAGDAARRWADNVRAVRRDLPLFTTARTIRYEDLIERGEQLLAELFEFLGLPLPIEQVREIFESWRFEACGDRAKQDSLVVHERVRGGFFEPDGFHRSGRAGGWRDSLDAEQLRAVESEAGDLLRELGYDDSPRPAPAPVPAAPDPEPPPGAFISRSPRTDVLWAYPSGVGIIDRTNAQMVWRERLFLYSTVLALVPERCLEVGVCEGGSSRIIHAALNDLGRGRLISIDPCPRVTPEVKEALADRVTFLTLPSPGGLDEARTAADGLFDFVLLDGAHSAHGVFHDLLGLVECVRPGGAILAHDAYYHGVAQGIRSALGEGLPLADGGIVSTTRHPGTESGRRVEYGGFRLLVRVEDDRRPRRGLVRRVARKLRSIVSR